MKKAITTIFQFFLFFIVFGAFSLFPPFHIEHVLNSNSSGTRIFIVDGLLLAFILYLLIVLAEFLMKCLRTSAPLTTVAFFLAAILGLLMKFGFLTRSAF
ncbi:hypothetical protein [Tunturiibacter lichenicola]|uniref:hypothetical protein n=1 Tax=Tunturiibacter lichenicola TaxID=2051959 RepID=UPI0021B447A1|nr:hypothetical protein [Edaphobacter lichenicola]